MPIVNPPRRIPKTLRTKLNKELNRMQRDIIVTHFTGPTDCIYSIVVAEKPKTDKLRVMLDPHPKALKLYDEAIRRPHYPVRTIIDVTSRLAGATCFSLLDITHAFLEH